MQCVVPTCGTTEGSFKLFPRDGLLSRRWREAIQVGSGLEPKITDEQELNQYEICEQHFVTGLDQPQPDEFYYQEPTLFTHWYVAVKYIRLSLTHVLFFQHWQLYRGRQLPNVFKLLSCS